ncbi:MAG: 16S rRNA (guanine(527)-N(7))-methyltransferase RsmG [Defluviitaleaceae bacterium]|nr:16S rRNA (guanine(527)-N(7))-methyltransferase RsmG [Defluviitaleaceae bacterium]
MEIIKNWATKNGIEITQTQYSQLNAFKQLVLKKNKVMNLTAITDEVGFAVKHIIDSLTLLPHIPNQPLTLADIGTGAGFPGVVLGIMRPNITLTLIDSLNKRIKFLAEATAAINIHAECIHTRAEELKNRQFDICTARAVAPMDKLAKYTLPLVKHGGRLLAMKGQNITEELAKAEKAIKKHGAVVNDINIVNLTDQLQHSIVIIEKSLV